MAKQDLKGAEILFEHDADLGIVCFHCQQAIEKSLKGYLISVSGTLQDGHSLLKLCKKAANYSPLFLGMMKDMTYVNVYYIETRYPADDPLYVSHEDAVECLAITTRVFCVITDIINEEP